MQPNAKPAFDGFFPPEANYSKLPHQFIGLMQHIDTLAEMKVIIYILRHTWGYHSFDGKPRRITLDEFENGVKDRHGNRLDQGCGLKRHAIRQGLNRAKEHGFVLHEQDSSDKARVKNAYMLVMVSVIQSDPVDHPATTYSESRVIHQITQSDPPDHSGGLNGSPDQKKTVEKDNQELDRKSVKRAHAHTRESLTLHSRYRLHRKPKTITPAIEAQSAESVGFAAQITSTPNSAPPPPPVAGTPVPPASDERRCKRCERMRPRSAFFRLGWRYKVAREDQLEEWCALCRADEKHLPEDDQSEYERRLGDAAQERLDREAATLSLPPNWVDNDPLWLAYKAAWKKYRGDTLIVPSQTRARYETAVLELRAMEITPERIEAAVEAIINKERYTYLFWYLPADIQGFGGHKAVPAAPPPPSADPVRASITASLPEAPPDDYYPPVMWRQADPEQTRRAMWADLRSRGAAYDPMTINASRRLMGLRVEEGVTT